MLSGGLATAARSQPFCCSSLSPSEPCFGEQVAANPGERRGGELGFGQELAWERKSGIANAKGYTGCELAGRPPFLQPLPLSLPASLPPRERSPSSTQRSQPIDFQLPSLGLLGAEAAKIWDRCRQLEYAGGGGSHTVPPAVPSSPRAQDPADSSGPLGLPYLLTGKDLGFSWA